MSSKMMGGQGQSIADRVIAAKHSIAGQGLAKSVCKATTEELLGPKKKHLDYLLQCTNEPNVSIPNLANLLIERTQHHNWIVVFKGLVTIHNLMNYGNERFTQYLASNNCTFQLGSFLDKGGVQGYDMSTFIRRYAKYLNEKAYSYRQMAFDFCKVKRGKDDGLLRTMNGDKLLKTLPVLQNQLDALLEFDCTPNELTNGVINACFMVMFKDLIRLFACYNDGIINLLEKYFEMNKKQCREALDIYKRFLVRMDKVSEFLKVAENVGIDKGDIPDLAKMLQINARDAPSSLLDALEQHLASLEGAKKGTTVTAPRPAGVTSAINSFASASASANATVTEEEKRRILEDENRRLEQLKEQRMLEQQQSPPSQMSTNPFSTSQAPTTQTTSPSQSVDLFGGSAATQSSVRPSDDLLGLGGPTSNPFNQNAMAAQPSQNLFGDTSAGWGGPAPAATGASGPSVVNNSTNVQGNFASDAEFTAVFGNSSNQQQSGGAIINSTTKPPPADAEEGLDPFGPESASAKPAGPVSTNPFESNSAPTQPAGATDVDLFGSDSGPTQPAAPTNVDLLGANSGPTQPAGPTNVNLLGSNSGAAKPAESTGVDLLGSDSAPTQPAGPTVDLFGSDSGPTQPAGPTVDLFGSDPDSIKMAGPKGISAKEEESLDPFGPDSGSSQPAGTTGMDPFGSKSGPSQPTGSTGVDLFGSDSGQTQSAGPAGMDIFGSDSGPSQPSGPPGMTAALDSTATLDAALGATALDMTLTSERAQSPRPTSPALCALEAKLDITKTSMPMRSTSPGLESKLDFSKTSVPAMTASPVHGRLTPVQGMGQTVAIGRTSPVPGGDITGFDGFGEVMKPIGSQAQTTATQKQDNLIKGDLDTSLALLAGNLNINGPGYQVKKPGHQWTGGGEKKLTGGANWSGQPLSSSTTAPQATTYPPMGGSTFQQGMVYNNGYAAGVYPAPGYSQNTMHDPRWGGGMMGYQQPGMMGSGFQQQPMGMPQQRPMGMGMGMGAQQPGFGMQPSAMGQPRPMGQQQNPNDPFGSL